MNNEVNHDIDQSCAAEKTELSEKKEAVAVKNGGEEKEENTVIHENKEEGVATSGEMKESNDMVQ